MTPEQHFMTYAIAFEETYEDDDWSRIEPFFADDATYEVRASAFGCRLVGPPAIVAGIKKSLDGFDRRLDSRAVEVTAAPRTEGDTVTVDWAASYARAGAPNLRFEGRSQATVRDGRIVALVDEYTPEESGRMVAWLAAHAPELDVSYA